MKTSLFPNKRIAATNPIVVLLGVATFILVIVAWSLYQLGRPANHAQGELVMYCAAGMRQPVEEIAAEYRREFGVKINPQYGGSNTLLSQLTMVGTGDLYLAADESYLDLAAEKGLVREILPLAKMSPVIAVPQGNPKQISSVDDLLRDDVTLALGNPDQAAIGKMVRNLLTDSGHWDRIAQQMTKRGVYQPTVTEVANQLKLGTVDAAIVWNTTLAFYPTLQSIETAELNRGASNVTLGVLSSCKQSPAALHFARYLAAHDRGLPIFEKYKFHVVEGDRWESEPHLTFYCGAVNRRAVEAAVAKFEAREGVRVNTKYDGCGILTAQMELIRDEKQDLAFPDTYMACDVYYLDAVRDMFQEAVNVSDTEVVIVVPKGNPKGIRTLADLAEPGIQIATGQPEQCTIGILTKQLLESAGLSEAIQQNVRTQTTSSALLIPLVAATTVDAVLAYATDAQAEQDRVDVIRVEMDAAKAVQPFSIARSSEQKHLSRRFYHTILEARDAFESAGFHWLLDAAPASTSADETTP